MTVRSHGPRPSPELMARLERDAAVAVIYLLPHVGAPYLEGKVRPLPACFDGEQYYPELSKDRNLVIRFGPALAALEYRSFFQAAQACPDHRFVLAVATSPAHEDYAQELANHNRSLGNPLDIHLDLARDDLASLIRQAGLCMHSSDPGAAIELSHLLVQAMAAGCWVLARRTAATESILGTAGYLFDNMQEAVTCIQESAAWDDESWQRRASAAADRAYSHFADIDVLQPLVEEWQKLANQQSIRVAA